VVLLAHLDQVLLAGQSMPVPHQNEGVYAVEPSEVIRRPVVSIDHAERS